MWIEICFLEITGNTNINNITKILSDHRGKLKLFNNKQDTYTMDTIFNIIIHYYFHTKNNPEKFINIDDKNILSINTDLISKYKTEPIFNAICSIIIRNNSIINIPNIEKLSIPSKCNIDAINSIFTIEKTNNFKIELFDYQQKTIMRMIEIENNINMEFNRSMELNMGSGDSVVWDPHYDTINNNNYNNNITKVISYGGILSDTMGLGKTITTIGLLHYGKTIPKEEIISNKIYSGASLIIVPAHLSKQWVDEYIKVHKINKKIVVILTKVHHDKLTYKEMIEADIIIVTIQFLLNIKNYCAINYRGNIYDTRGRNEQINDFYNNIIKTDYNKLTNPLFEYFHFNRVIIDEGHELMEQVSLTGRQSNYINTLLDNITSKYKWYISGTPFTTFTGLKNVCHFLGIKFIVNNETMIPINDFSSRYFDSFYINNSAFINIYNYMSTDTTIEAFLNCIMIRHLKKDVEGSIKLLGHEEQIEWVELTQSETSIYKSNIPNKHHITASDKIRLQQICCHPLIAETYKKIVGNDPISLENVQDKLIEHHTDNIEKYTNKIEKLDKTNQAYSMLLSKYKSIVSESKFVLNTLQKINEKMEFDEEENCIICYEVMKQPILTPCGHMFCNTCIQLCINIKPECPMCKSSITSDKLIDVKKKLVKENGNQLVNPLILKYGTKLGKLIQITRSLLSQDARIIIFSQWDNMLTLIGKSMLENGIDCSFISGNVYKKNKAINKFKMGNNNSVILLSLAKSASGTNLTEATHIIIVEPIDNTKENIKAIEGQAIGRAVRLGQKQVIKVIRILCKNTIEEEIYNTSYIGNE
jgi:DNA repair protein RAD5